MKKLIIPFLLVMTLVFQSCEETQSPIYDGSQTLAYFNATPLSANLGVLVSEQSATYTVPINVSTLSSSDRTVSVSAAASSTATPNQYSFSGSVTIPANSYSGELVVTGIQDGLTQTGDNLVLQIDGVDDGGVGSPSTFTLTIVQLCPFDIADYYGDYTAVGGDVFNPGTDYTITAVAGPDPNTLLLSNAENRGTSTGMIMLELDPDTGFIEIVSETYGTVLYVHPTFGNVTATVAADTNPSTFNVCTQTMVIDYIGCVSAGCFTSDRGFTLEKQ